MVTTTMRPLHLLLSFGIVLLLPACRKDSGDEAPAPSAPAGPAAMSAYSNLQSGNYWIYRRFKVDSNDAVIDTLGLDSMWVVGDTVLTDGTFAHLRRIAIGAPNSYPIYWRDSSTYLVTSSHERLFCTAPLDEVIYTVVQGPVGVIIDYTVHSTPVQVSVGAGDFSTYLMRAHYTSIGGYPEQPAWKELRSHWAANVGRVRYYEFYGSYDWGFRYDLQRHHVQ